MARIHALDAMDILDACAIPRGVDFFTLRNAQVLDLLNYADMRGYRAPRHANGSRARYFHAYLERQIAAGHKSAIRTARRLNHA
jgi:hypothetical protein